MDLSPGRYKQAGARLGEFVGRFKLNGRLISGSPSTPVLELEMLSAGVMGKSRLWQTLDDLREVLAVDRAALVSVQTRAERHLADIGRAHQQIRADAFMVDTGVACLSLSLGHVIRLGSAAG